MIIKTIIDEDFTNYKKPSMFIGFPNCTFKCEKDCGERVCQNSTLSKTPDIIFTKDEIIERYLSNNISQSIVMGGLEPFDSWKELLYLVNSFRLYTDDDIVIYTGYNKEEIETKVNILERYENIIIKFGRFIPHQESHFDEVLGIRLASPNQYAERIS